MLVVGLGNPGSRYAATRHNLGANVVIRVADRLGARIKRARRGLRAEIAETRIGSTRVVLALPTSFMNESGQVVAPLVRYYGMDHDDLLVCHDDIDLEFAKIRVQHGRGAGGNNGVTSVIGSLGHRDFWRMKLGVGRPPRSLDPASFVLKPFSSVEREEVQFMIEHGADLVATFASESGEAARQAAGELNGGA